MRRLTLVYPNQRWKKEDKITNWNLDPRTLCLLGAMVNDLVEVEIIDAQFHDMSIDEVKERLSRFAPDCVGISILTSAYQEILHIAARAAKEALPRSPW